MAVVLKEMQQMPIILQMMEKLGYKVFTGKNYDLNIFGIRAPIDKAGEFNDIIGVCYRLSGNWRTEIWSATTDPTKHWLENPMKTEGTAILVPGQYRGAWKLGLHRGQYEALVQRTGVPVKVYRDADRDDILEYDPATIQEGLFGINIHTGGGQKASAGCQVIPNKTGFNRLIDLCQRQVAMNDYKTFSYTLLRWQDLFGEAEME